MRLEVNVQILGKPLRAEFENEARGGREGGGSLVAHVQIVSKVERLERSERFFYKTNCQTMTE